MTQEIVRCFTESERAIVLNANIDQSTKNELLELMDELLTDGSFSKERILKRMEATVRLEESRAAELAAEFADIERCVNEVFSH